jgi:hypothetical protein
MPSRNATGPECAAMKSPTIFDQASITSVSCRRSRNPRRCISFGTSSVGDCHRSGRIFLSGKPRHSAITAARRDGFIRNYLATDEHGWNTDFLRIIEEVLRKAPVFFDSAVGTTAATAFRSRLNTSAACGLAEYLARCGTWPRCVARSEYRARRESRRSRDRLTARCRSRALPNREWLL